MIIDQMLFYYQTMSPQDLKWDLAVINQITIEKSFIAHNNPRIFE